MLKISTLPRVRKLTRPEREKALLTLDRYTELPLLLLAFLMVPLVAGPYIWELTNSEKALLSSLNIIIWAAFAADLSVKTLIAPRRLRYLRSHWLDVLIVALPFIRPLRVLRLFVYGSRAFQGARSLSKADFIVVYAFGSLVIATTVIVAFEREANSQLSDFPEALWWGIVTITTVGYGDVTPVTTGGRIVAGLLMLTGIGMFSVLTANFASKFVAQDEKGEDSAESQILVEIRELKAEVSALRAELADRESRDT